MATENLLAFAKKKNVLGFVFFGAVSSYGQVPQEILSLDTKHQESDDYGITKLVAERLVRESNIPNRILVLPGVVGSGGNMNNWLIRTTLALKRNEKVEIYNKNGYFNNVVDSSSICRFVDTLLSRGISGSETYILAAKDKIKVSELINMISMRVNSSSDILYMDDKRGFYIDNEKALRAGYDPPSMDDIVDYVCAQISDII